MQEEKEHNSHEEQGSGDHNVDDIDAHEDEDRMHNDKDLSSCNKEESVGECEEEEQCGWSHHAPSPHVHH